MRMMRDIQQGFPMSCVITTTAKAAVVISEMPMNRLARLAYSGHRDAQAAYDEMEPDSGPRHSRPYRRPGDQDRAAG